MTAMVRDDVIYMIIGRKWTSNGYWVGDCSNEHSYSIEKKSLGYKNNTNKPKKRILQ